MAEQAIDESPGRALLIVLGVAVACALLVSVTAVSLRPYQVANVERHRLAQLDSIVAALSATGRELTTKDIESRVVELATGRYADDIDAATFDARKAETDPGASSEIPAEQDSADIKRRANHAVVYLVRDAQRKLQLLILPVYGSGYQSMLRGFLALEGDASKVAALRFYEQGDTPGLGGRIQEPEWEAQWTGKRVYDKSGDLRLGVVTSDTPPASADGRYMVDGISGATRTSRGVHGLLRFWLGDLGFGPYLERVREGRG